MRLDTAPLSNNMRPSPCTPRPAPLSISAGWLRLCALLCALVLAGATAPAARGQATIYVDHSATGRDNGSSWTDAYTSLQSALNFFVFFREFSTLGASTDAYTSLKDAPNPASGTNKIYIAQGTYYPDEGQTVTDDDRSETFTIAGPEDGLKIYGGFETGDDFADRSPTDHPVILSGDIDKDNTSANNSYHVVVMDGGDGIGEDFDANITSATELDGITIANGNADESAPDNNGGGLYCDGNGSGNVCSPTLTNVVFSENEASSSGGAVYNNGNAGTSSPRIANAVFSGNSAGLFGGAISNDAESGTSSPAIINSTFSGNSSDLVGGAIDNNADRGENITPEIRNSVLYGNTPDQIANNNATPAVTNSLVEGGVSGTGNIDADPQFADANDPDGADDTFGTADDGLRLTSGSPAIDAGDNGAISETTDLIGGDRTLDGTVDMGAYEFAAPPASPTGLRALGQASATGEVNLTWDSNSESNIDSYNVTRATSKNGTYSAVATVSHTGGGESYTDTNVTNGQLYFYKLSAVNTSGSESSTVLGAAEPEENKFSVTVTLANGGVSNTDDHGTLPTDVDGSYTADSEGNIRTFCCDETDGSGDGEGVETSDVSTADITITPSGLKSNQTWYFYYDDDTVGGYPVRNNTGGAGTGTKLVTGTGNTSVTLQNTGQDGAYMDYLFYADPEPGPNSAPTVSNLTGTTYVLGGPAISLDGDVTLSDPDMTALNAGVGNYNGASLTVQHSGGANADDAITVSDPGANYSLSGSSINRGGEEVATFTSSGGSLTVNFSGTEVIPTDDIVNDIAQSITYETTDGGAEATLEWTFSDGTASATETQTVAFDGASVTLTGADGTGQDAGWRMFSFPEAITLADIEANFSFNFQDVTGAVVYRWDPAAQDWVAVENDTDNIAAAEGVAVYFFDDNDDPIESGGFTLAVPGTDTPGSNSTQSGLNQTGRFLLMGNPYTSAFDLSELDMTAANGFQQVAQVWDPGAGSFTQITRGTESDNIAGMQGFFVERSTPGEGATSLTFNSSGVQNGPGSFVGTKSEAPALASTDVELRLVVESEGDTLSQNRATVLFHEGAAPGWDAYDATQLAPPGNGAHATLTSPIERLGSLTQRRVAAEPFPEGTPAEVPLSVRSVGTEGGTDGGIEGTAHIESIGAPDASGPIELIDAETGATVDLRAEGYSFPLAAGDGSIESPSEARFTLRAGAGALPVELTRLTATPDAGGVLLEWTTTAETQNAGFEVERQSVGEGNTSSNAASGDAASGDAASGDWTTVGFVEGAGTTTEAQAYRFRAEGLPVGTHRFRLRQLDADGTATLSAPVTATVRLAEAYRVTAPAPNPATSGATMRLAVREAQPVRVAVYDVLGREVRVVFDGPMSAQQPTTLRIGEGLPAGQYFVRAVGERFSATERLTVVR